MSEHDSGNNGQRRRMEAEEQEGHRQNRGLGNQLRRKSELSTPPLVGCIFRTRALNGEEEAADELAEPAVVAEEMLRVGSDGVDRQAVRAAQMMEERFQEWGAARQDKRR